MFAALARADNDLRAGPNPGGSAESGTLRARGVRRWVAQVPTTRRLVGIEYLPELALLGGRPDLYAQCHDDAGPQRHAERVEQVAGEQQRPRRRALEQKAADMGGQSAAPRASAFRARERQMRDTAG